MKTRREVLVTKNAGTEVFALPGILRAQQPPANSAPMVMLASALLPVNVSAIQVLK